MAIKKIINDSDKGNSAPTLNAQIKRVNGTVFAKIVGNNGEVYNPKAADETREVNNETGYFGTKVGS